MKQTTKPWSSLGSDFWITPLHWGTFSYYRASFCFAFVARNSDTGPRRDWCTQRVRCEETRVFSSFISDSVLKVFRTECNATTVHYVLVIFLLSTLWRFKLKGFIWLMYIFSPRFLFSLSYYFLRCFCWRIDPWEIYWKVDDFLYVFDLLLFPPGQAWCISQSSLLLEHGKCHVCEYLFEENTKWYVK